MTFKRTAREEGSEGVFQPALAIPLLKSELLSENLLQNNVYLKVDGTASGSQG